MNVKRENIDLLDSHTHTIVSGHAYNTINEMIAAAREKNLKVLAITEHGPDTPGACHKIYFENLKVLPRKRGDLTTLFGAEVNILNSRGDLDLSEKLLNKLDVVVASIHPPTYTGKTVAENTNAYVNAMKNHPQINILGHPDDGRFPVDYQILVLEAKANHVLLEVNEHSMEPGCSRLNAIDNYREMLAWCRKYQHPIIIDSDAHVDVAVGGHERSWKFLEEIGFPEDLIANSNLELYYSYINYKE